MDITILQQDVKRSGVAGDFNNRKWSNSMFEYKKTFVLILLSFSLLLNPLSALTATGGTSTNKEPNSPEAMTVDLIFLRPLGLVATVAGTLVFVVALPFSALGGNTQGALASLVISPAEYTFLRPLGDTE
jgi:hypothetical protein